MNRLPGCAALVAAWMAGAAAAQAPDGRPRDVEALKRCAAIDDARDRLACYDAAVPRPAEPPSVSPLLDQVKRALTPDSGPPLIDDRWAIGVSATDSRFDLRPHKPSYFLVGRYSDSPNRLPASPTKPALADALSIKEVEAKFQVSFKVKLADFDDVFGAAVWAGYTQQSQWQVYNSGVSRPFRETNYEPEVMLAFHPDRTVLGWRWRLMALGLNHQSNGRDEPLSRSWNRITATFGFDQGNFGLLIRPWLRIRESREKDDNPDITRYQGYGDVVGVYRYRDNTLALLARYNPATGYGAGQLTWSFPLHRRVRGHLQVFTGYGESLIDYNVRQNTIGLGISLADWL
jgi:phospholipase A1